MKVSLYYPVGRLQFEADTNKNPPEFSTQREIGGGGPVVKTKQSLEEIGIETKLFSQWYPDSDFDVFYVDGSSYETKKAIEAVKLIERPVVVVTAAYSSRPVWQFWAWKYIEKVLPIPTVYGLRQKVYNMADVLISSSESEIDQLKISFDIDDEKINFIPWCIDRKVFRDPDDSPFVERYGLKNFVLQVGRINERKGQTRLIRALDGTGLEVVFAGELHAQDPEERDRFLGMVEERDWAHYVGPLSHDEMLPSAYAAAKVHVLPSKFEFPGMVTLEAAAAGCSVVSGPYPTIKDYLGDRIYYCDPTSLDSIRTNVEKAFRNEVDESLSEFVLENYTWLSRAKRLKKMFKKIA
ncbi:glycosyltransferase family 4 protein [Salinibacter ruber]|uniref:glycosyltransferase family 4 protein n=1 Tax=Salinibacter ruber TaxID=146919 RepID=UPI00216AA285|nr:glycosyltransferase family 4 protein [Salinibacter ruber]MCS4055902.1 hypothetical protein [Salinibacter ruber]